MASIPLSTFRLSAAGTYGGSKAELSDEEASR